MALTTLWFCLVAVLFAGYFMLEGFDFGIGMLVGVLAKDDRERRVLINTVGPVWDGNEVWILTGGGALFAAFPEWYATMFSGFYLALFLILFALIIRGVAFEYRGKRDSAAWRRGWDWCIVVGSFLPALLWGVAVGNIANFVKTDFVAGKFGSDTFQGVHYVGNFFDLLNPYSLLAGLVTLTAFLTHGAMFAGLKTTGDIRKRAHQFALKSGLVCAVLCVSFLGWTLKKMFNLRTTLNGIQPGLASDIHRVPMGVIIVLALLVALTFVGGLAAAYLGRDGWAFAGTAVAIVLFTFFVFSCLFPFVLPSSTNLAASLSTAGQAGTVAASSSSLTLKIMTGVALVMTPIVVAYQAWTYWVFRKRIGTHHIPEETPVSA